MALWFPGLVGRTLIGRAQLMLHHWGIRHKKREIPVPEKPFAMWKKEGPPNKDTLSPKARKRR